MRIVQGFLFSWTKLFLFFFGVGQSWVRILGVLGFSDAALKISVRLEPELVVVNPHPLIDKFGFIVVVYGEDGCI